MLLDVPAWHRADVLDHLRPRVLSWSDTRTVPGVAAEIVVWDDIRDRLGGQMHPWSIMGVDRSVREPGIVWHCSHGRADYEALAKRYGLELDPDFTCAGWQAQGGYKW